MSYTYHHVHCYNTGNTSAYLMTSNNPRLIKTRAVSLKQDCELLAIHHILKESSFCKITRIQ